MAFGDRLISFLRHVAFSDKLIFMRKRQTPYQTVISRFGGVSKLASALGIRNHTTVLRWKDRGFIPAHHMEKVINAAKEGGIGLTLEELVLGAVEGETDSDEDHGQKAGQIAA